MKKIKCPECNKETEYTWIAVNEKIWQIQCWECGTKIHAWDGLKLTKEGHVRNEK
jgi:transcription elongation factor Elf1